LTVKSKIFKGLQRRGKTHIDSTIKIEKTGPMEITVRAGTFTDVNGETFTLTSDKVITLTDGTDNYVALIYNPDTGVVDIWHTTEPEPTLPSGFKLIQPLIRWGWFVIPTGTTDIANIPLYCMTWIDNVGIIYKLERDPRFRIVKRIKFCGKGEETGKVYEFDEIEHFIADIKGTYFMCPNDGVVSRGRPCKKCGNMDTVKIKVKK